MKSKWKVRANPYRCSPVYAVFRTIDTSKPDHPSNCEYATEWMINAAEAVSIARRLNEEEGCI